jgi:hypothetical protein
VLYSMRSDTLAVARRQARSMGPTSLI